MKIVFSTILLMHGLLHLIGFAKAFNPGSDNLLYHNYPQAVGVMWMLTGFLFIASSLAYQIGNHKWWMFSIPGVICSQIIVFTYSEFLVPVTIVNTLVLVMVIIGYATRSFLEKYEKDVAEYLKVCSSYENSLLTEEDIVSLPEPVKRYIRYSGAINKPKVKNFKVEFAGQIRKNEQSEWMPFTSEQYNFIYDATRLFFMKAAIKHLPVAGYHCFKNGNAFMDIRLLSLFRVQYQKGREMDISETVTFFNDMCCFAPGSLVDKRIQWITSERDKVEAEFTNNGVTIAAELYFNDKGELINFISTDRYAVTENNNLKQMVWQTPVKYYVELNGNTIPGYAEAIYNYPEGEVCYGTFTVKNIEYNCADTIQM